MAKFCGDSDSDDNGGSFLLNSHEKVVPLQVL